MTAFAAVETRSAEEWRHARAAIATIDRAVPDEVPVGIAYDGRPHAVLMATPTDIENLALGFTLSEGIAPVEAVEAIAVTHRDEGILAEVTLSPAARRNRAQWRRRSMEGRSSCGLCGVEKLERAMRDLAPLDDGLVVARPALGRALAALAGGQALGRETRATHAAAWAHADGAIAFIREDVGRHNALDKLIGAAARARLDPAAAFVIVTSRCSYEMVEKTVSAGVAVLVAISAPTALAIRKAEEAGLTLVALARDDGHAVFTRPDRIADPVSAEVPA